MHSLRKREDNTEAVGAPREVTGVPHPSARALIPHLLLSQHLISISSFLFFSLEKSMIAETCWQQPKCYYVRIAIVSSSQYCQGAQSNRGTVLRTSRLPLPLI